MSDSSSRSSLRQLFAKSVPTVIVLGILGAGWLAVHEINTGSDGEATVAAEEESGSDGSGVVRLPEGKLRAGGLTTESVHAQPVQHSHVIPGRLGYDETRHIDLKTPVEGILTDVLVKPGDAVAEGTLLAVVNSPEIGRARADVLKLEAELVPVTRAAEQATSIAANLDELLKSFQAGSSSEEIETEFDGKALGSYRQELLTAYFKLHLAAKNYANVKPLTKSGAIAGRTVLEHELEHQVAQADYRSACEKAAFETQQQQLQATSELHDAERRLKIARQQRDSLLGYHEGYTSDSRAEDLSKFEVRAPFAGTIETRSYAKSERVSTGDSLFILADTSALYVSANLRESDWPAIAIQAGQTIAVLIPAIPNREFSADVVYVGREVAVDSNSIPVVAKIDNADGLLRPGMFVRVVVPVSELHNALAVRSASILQHENRDFVFVALANGTFARTDVSTGTSSDDWVEVTSGLQSGQQVVVDGAFVLKSELLLEGEDE